MDLIEYIKAQEQKGYTQEQVIFYLVQNGYNQEVVMQAVNAINQERMEGYEAEAKVNFRDVLQNPGAVWEALKDSLSGMTKKGKESISGMVTVSKDTYEQGTQTRKAFLGKFFAIAVVVIILVAIGYGVLYFLNRPVCGNGEIEDGETSQTCCDDAGCIGDQVCTPTGCTDPICDDCMYLDNHKCIRYECCKNSDCLDGEICQLNECVEVQCNECQYLEGVICKDYTCCHDSDCEDGNENTIDRCIEPETKNSTCSYEAESPCMNDSDCDDGDPNTKDTCEGLPKSCFNKLIEDCTSADGLCPPGCSYDFDTDCEECGNEIIGVGEQCDDGNDDGFDKCTNQCMYNEYYTIPTSTAPGEMLSINWDFGGDFESIKIDFEINELEKSKRFSFYLFETTIGDKYIAFVINNSGLRLISDATADNFNFKSPSLRYNRSNVTGVFTPFDLGNEYYSFSLEKHIVDGGAWYKCVLTEKSKGIHTWCGSFRSDSKIAMYANTRFIFPGTKWPSQKFIDIPDVDIFIHSILRDLDKKPVHAASSYSDPNYGDHIPMENVLYNETLENYRMSFGPEVIRKNKPGRMY